MTESKLALINFKERIVYELAISLGLDPTSPLSSDLPDFEDPLYNIHLALIENLNILKAMKEV
jgi:hypothetical protein